MAEGGGSPDDSNDNFEHYVNSARGDDKEQRIWVFMSYFKIEKQIWKYSLSCLSVISKVEYI